MTEKMERLSRRLTAPGRNFRPPAKLDRTAPRDLRSDRSGSSYSYSGGHPVNYSPPWMEGTRSVGSTLTLHVGGWWNAEFYEIVLWQWTSAHGWQIVGSYYLSTATSMQVYLGWEWAYSLIGFEVYAYNSNPWQEWMPPVWSGEEYVYPYWGRPWNYSPPWLEGTAAVGQTVNLHVGGWAEAEQYAIHLYRWTAAAGWTFIGDYHLGGATSMSLYLGTDWADSYIGFYAFAWNPPHGWSDPAWTGPYWVDPRRPVNASRPYVAGTPRVGNTVSLHVGQWHYTEQYAVQLHRWTAATGWTYIATYYIGSATSMSLYLGTDWADSYIGFYAWAWNGIWGWSANAWSGEYWVDSARPVNVSGPYVEGTREVGRTVSLHVGQWRNTEQYAIELHRWTAAAGWTYIGTYYIGSATSMSLYLGTDWADAYIGFYAWAWNGIWGWSANAWSGAHWVDPARPVNVSGPFVAGTREVGSTVSLNVGQWQRTEQYAIELHRWTASTGWTYLTTYYIGSATSMSLYLGWEWADSYIGFYAWGWNSVWGWSTYAWSGEHYVDPLSVRVDLAPLRVTTYDPAVTSSSTDWRANVTTTISDPSSSETYRWRFHLAPNQRLERLASGDVAVVEPEEDQSPHEDDGIAEEDRFSDQYAEDVEAPPETEEPDLPDEEQATDPDEPTEPEDEPTSPDAWDGASDYDGEYDPGADDPSGDSDELTVLYAAQAEVDGKVVAVASIETAHDGAGNPVPAWFTVAGNVVALTVSHRNGGYSYPVRTSAVLVEDRDHGEAGEGGAGMRAFAAEAAAAPDCSGGFARIVTWNTHGWAKLGNAFATYPARCSRYYITVSPQKDADSAPHAFLQDRKWRPYHGSAAKVHTLNNRNNVRNAGATFRAVAEFNWGEWGLAMSEAPIDAKEAGKEFREWMDREGYDHWAINELPRATRTNPKYQNRARRLIEGLYSGRNGPVKRGIVFMVNHGQNAASLGVYKGNMKSFTTNQAFWRAMRAHTVLWSQETYVRCSQTCEPGKSPNAKARTANAFIQHPARLAYAPDAPRGATGPTATAARILFNTHYVPLLNAFWRQKKFDTHALPLDRMNRLVSLQVYATRAWARGGAPYPGRRIGFAWNETAGIPKEWDKNDPRRKPQERRIRLLAERLARAVQGAYGPNGRALAACPGGLAKGCNPSKPEARLDTDWQIFRFWD